MKLRIISLLILCTMILFGCEKQHQSTQPFSITGKFIESHFIKSDDIQTDLTANKNVYLSESIGLWMHYLLETNNQKKFDAQVDCVKSKFLLENELISWQISNGKVSQTNALIDDFRIMSALYSASKRWNVKSYEQLANKIANSLVKHQMVNHYFVDFFDGTTTNNFITLSYLDPIALKELKEHNRITDAQYESNIELVYSSPLQNGWFPQRYHVKSQQFEYEPIVNLIDQYYIGYHRALLGGSAKELVHFTEQKLSKDGKLFGRVDATTFENIVEYESPAVYALAYLMMRQLGEDQLAQQLITKMHSLRVSNEESAYYGGYIELDTLETHFFDNILPALAEEGWHE